MADVPTSPYLSLSPVRLATPFGSPSTHANEVWSFASPNRDSDATGSACRYDGDTTFTLARRQSLSLMELSPPDVLAAPRGRHARSPEVQRLRPPSLLRERSAPRGRSTRSLSTTRPLQPGPAALALRNALSGSPGRQPPTRRVEPMSHHPRLGSPLRVAQHSQPLMPRLSSPIRFAALGPGAGLGLRWGFAPGVGDEPVEALWEVAKQRLAGAIALPCYGEGEQFEDEDGGRLTVSREMKLRQVELSCLRPLRIGVELEPAKTTQVLLTLARDGKFTPLKVNARNEVVDGNHRFAVAQGLHLRYVTVVLEQLWPTPQRRR